MKLTDAIDTGSLGDAELRDYFAGLSITGWIASRESNVHLAKCGGDVETAMMEVANAAYILADAMMARREEGGGS